MQYGLSKSTLQYNSKKRYFFKPFKLKEDDPITKLVSNFAEVEMYLKRQNKKSKFKNLYLDIKNIYDILYEENKAIFIKYEDCYQSLSEYYYLVKLINIKSNILINFTYSLDFIEKINNSNKNCLKPLRKIIIAKIILVLVQNYKGFDWYERDNQKIKEIEQENKDIIKNNLRILEEIGLNFSISSVENVELEDLYVEIVYSLIEKDTIKNNFKYVIKKFNQMDLHLIDISKKFYDKYLEHLLSENNNNNKFINKYLIRNSSHIYKNMKIFFHYILFNYILKDTLYIYQIPYLLKIRKIIINEIKNNIDFFPVHLSKKIKGKIILMVNKLLDCDYYKNILQNYLNKIEIEKKAPLNNNENDNNQYDKNQEIRFNNFYPSRFKKNNKVSTNAKTTIKNNLKIDEKSSEFIIDDSSNNKDEYLYEKRTDLNKECQTNFEIDYNSEIFNNYLICLKTFNCDKVFLEQNNQQFIEYQLQNKKWNKFKICDNQSKRGMRINDDLIIRVENSYIGGKKDKVEIYNIAKQSVVKTIKNYSISMNLSGYAVKNEKILFLPCKKYVKGQKNGILIISIENNRRFMKLFKDTGNFQVNCICPLLNAENKENDYFLVGGYDNKKKENAIRLYKIIVDKKNTYWKIEYIDEIDIKKNENLDNFEKPIYFIKQSKNTGHIFIYSDKKIYLFSPLNLTKFLLFEENEKISSLFEGENKESENKGFYDNINDFY